MLDIKFIRENSDVVKMAIAKKHIVFDLDALVAKDDERLAVLKEVESLRAEQNAASNGIAGAGSPEEKEDLVAKMRAVKEILQAKEEELKNILYDWREMMLKVPNVPDVSVPDGESDEDNLEIFSWGEKTQFAFEPKDHIELMEKLDLADFERGAKVSGFRGYFLKNDGAMLEFALWQYF